MLCTNLRGTVTNHPEPLSYGVGLCINHVDRLAGDLVPTVIGYIRLESDLQRLFEGAVPIDNELPHQVGTRGSHRDHGRVLFLPVPFYIGQPHHLGAHHALDLGLPLLSQDCLTRRAYRATPHGRLAVNRALSLRSTVNVACLPHEIVPQTGYTEMAVARSTLARVGQRHLTERTRFRLAPSDELQLNAH